MTPPLLDRPFGAPRNTQQTVRNLDALKQLTKGTLRRGELFRLVVGSAPRRPGQQQQAPEAQMPSERLCRGCNRPVTHAGEQLAQMKAWCRDCGAQRRREWNKRDRHTATTPQAPAPAEVPWYER